MRSVISNIEEKIFSLRKLINNQTKKQTLIFVILYLILSSLFLTLIVYCSQFGNPLNIINIILSNKISFLLTFLFISMINTGIFLISSSLLVTLLIVYMPIVILSIINYEKIKYRSEVLIPLDFLQIKEALNITASSVKINLLHPIMIVLALISIIFVVGALLIKKTRIKLYFRMISLIIIPITVYYFVFSPNCIVNRTIPTHIAENTVVVYNKKGFLLGFLNEIPNIILKNPNNYSEENVKKIYNLMNAEIESREAPAYSDVKPNIIVILNEAFTDPYYFNGIEYSIDPLNSIRDYMNDEGYLNMISPQLGGGTANVEYEVLTGVSTTLFGNSAIIYQQYINKSHFSLASYLNAMGYVSLGIHPYEDWFWRRNKVYPHLGFRNFYSIYEMSNQEKMGSYISDLSLSKEIIAKYEENSDNPLFISAVSMQNHSFYNLDRYKEDEIKVTISSDTISDGFAKEITEYVNGAYYASEALRYLIDYFESIDEPTYIVMYGDHMPYFADHVEEYFEVLGYKPNSKLEHLLYRTPAIFWSNQDKEKIETDYISSFFLGKEILKYSEIKLPKYFQLLDELNKEIKAASHHFVIDNENNFIYKKDYNGSLIDDVNMVAYDFNFGKNYLNFDKTGNAR